MKKTLILLALLLTLLSACAEDSEPVDDVIPVPEISADYLYADTEHIFLHCSPMEEYLFYLNIVSGSPITESELEALINSTLLVPDTDYDFFDRNGSGTEIPFYVYQMYRGKDWAEYAAKLEEADAVGESDAEAFEAAQKAVEECRDEFLDDYRKLQEEGKLPNLYAYRLLVFLPKECATTESTLTLRVHGRELTLPFGSLEYSAEAPLSISYDKISDLVGYAGYNTKWANADGLFYERDGKNVCTFEVYEAVTITSIRLLDDKRSLQDIDVTVSEPLASIDENGNDRQIVASYRYDGTSPLSLSAGQQLSIDFTFHDANFENILSGYTQYYVVLEYVDEAGNTGYTYQWFPMIVQTYGGSPHEIYLAEELGVDVMSYYTDYFYPIEGDYLLGG